MNEPLSKEVHNYINNFYKDESHELYSFRQSCEAEYVPIITPETQGFLSLLLKFHEPKRILEIGTGVGYSAIFFAKLLPQCLITTLELIEKRYTEANINIEKYGVDERVRIVTGDASITLDELIEENKNTEQKYDFVFIDSAKSRYLEFFDKSTKILSPDGIIVADNVMLNGRTASDIFMKKHRDRTSMLKMRDFIDYLKCNNKFETELFNIGDGLTVSRMKST